MDASGEGDKFQGVFVNLAVSKCIVYLTEYLLSDIAGIAAGRALQSSNEWDTRHSFTFSSYSAPLLAVALTVRNG